jgi:secondary thiamine-phosphate synthase enzyme
MAKSFPISTDKLFTNITLDVSSVIPTDFSGMCLVYTPHTTAAIALLEEELLHLVDVRFFLDTMAPKSRSEEGPHKNVKYLHDLVSLRADVPPDERVNGHSHIRSLFFASSVTVPVENGKLQLGEYKRIFFVELDPIRPRQYQVMLSEELKF